MDIEHVQQNDIEILQHTLREELDFPIERIAAMSSEVMGDHSSVFIGVHDSQNVVIKWGRPGGSFQTEAAALELMNQHGILSPKVLKVYEARTQEERPILVETHISGASLKALDEEANGMLYEQAGRVLQAMHAIRLKGFGELRVENGELKGARTTWQDFMASYEPRIQYAFENGFIDQTELRSIHAALQEILALDLPGGFFLHGDYQSMHIFSDGVSITGIIDPEYAMSGDPRLDVAYAHFFLTPQERIYFNQGYGAVADDPIVKHYILLTAVDKIRYRHMNGFTERLPQALSVLRTCLQEEK